MPSKDFRMNPQMMTELQAAVRKMREGLDDYGEACLRLETLPPPRDTTFGTFEKAWKRFQDAHKPILPSMVAMMELAAKLEAKYN